MMRKSKSFSPKDLWKSLQESVTRHALNDLAADLYLKDAITATESHDGKNERISFGASSVQGWRLFQEDAHLADINFDRNAYIFGVFDGHNGGEVAQYCANKLPKFVLSNHHYINGSIESALKECFMSLDEHILKPEAISEMFGIRQHIMGIGNDKHFLPARDSGSTAIVVIIKEKTVSVANIGDSRCVICSNGRAIAMSFDHKPDDLSEKRRVENAGGTVAMGRINYGINISRALGDHYYKNNKALPANKQMIIATPDVKTYKLTKDDEFMVIACDGIWNCMSNQQVVNFVKKRIKSKQLSKICEELFKKCMATERPIDGRDGGDNMTCVIVKFDNILNN